MITRIAALFAFCTILLLAARLPAQAQATAPGSSIPAAALSLENGGFECPDYVDAIDERGRAIRIPAGWRMVNSAGETPVIYSAREWYAKSCERDAWVEHFEGRDAVILRAQDLETPPEPGKPFDTTLYQQVTVEPGGAYSVSGWFVSLCGGSFSAPNDCPDGYYMAKQLGIDPSGGEDPGGEQIEWVESRANFVEADGTTRIGWQNLRLSAVAESSTLTVLARINSPFQWHGNHAFIDALKIVRAPAAIFDALPQRVDGGALTVPWTGEQSPDVTALGGTYRLYIDMQVRPEGGEWRDLMVDGDESGELLFQAPCVDLGYDFRIRARAEQPPADEAGEGVWPNHRFPGIWSEPIGVYFASSSSVDRVEGGLSLRSFLPIIFANRDC